MLRVHCRCQLLQPRLLALRTAFQQRVLLPQLLVLCVITPQLGLDSLGLLGVLLA